MIKDIFNLRPRCSAGTSELDRDVMRARNIKEAREQRDDMCRQLKPKDVRAGCWHLGGNDCKLVGQ